MRIALAQINTTVGDLSGNRSRMVRDAKEAAARGADVVVFPELSLTGYPPRDLVERPSFLDRTAEHLNQLTEETRDLPLTLICGYAGRSPASQGKRATNSAAIIEAGEIVGRQHKMLLPTYDVFDEGRYFLSAERQQLFRIANRPVAVTICEDAWNDKQYWERRLYARDPVEELMTAGGEILLTINASPYHMGKRRFRENIFRAAARHHKSPVVFVNQVGGNDHLVFDGSSFAMNATGELLACAPSFEEALILVDLESGDGDLHASHRDECEAVYEALVLGTRDYIRKCGFRKVIIGLSGGIDSSLTAAIAVDAAGRENVTGVGMPGPYSSEGSILDARAMAERLGIAFELIPITPVFDTFASALGPLCHGVAEENLQSRIRGATLMALSNSSGALVLTTGNKSELAVGYCTLYGDMCGGLAAISDVPKTLVYELSRVANKRHNGAIPEAVFTKPPSAELRPDQKDTDTLPPYDLLDAILKRYVEDVLPVARIAEELSQPLELVQEIACKVDRNEYKRQQAAPGLKVTTKAFGMGRRFPIAQRFTE